MLGAPAQDIEDQLRTGLDCAGAPESEAALRCALGAHLLAEHRIAEATLTLHGAEALVPRCAAPRQIALRVRLGELMIAQAQSSAPANSSAMSRRSIPMAAMPAQPGEQATYCNCVSAICNLQSSVRRQIVHPIDRGGTPPIGQQRGVQVRQP